MVKKLTKRKDVFTLELDKKVTDALGITQKTDLDIRIVDDTLIIKPKNKKTRANQKRKKKFNDLTRHLMDKYESVLKKLAKTIIVFLCVH